MTPQQYASIHRFATKLRREDDRVEDACARVVYWEQKLIAVDPLDDATYIPKLIHRLQCRLTEADKIFNKAHERFTLCNTMLARRLEQVGRKMVIVDDYVYILGDHREITWHSGVADAVKEATNFALPSDRLNLEA